jgi:hypothetical protein
MLQPIRGRLASVRATPSRAEDARTVVRVMLEFHDIPVDPLIELLDEQVGVAIARAAPAATPLEMAIATAPETNGTLDDPITLPAAGRRRRGTQAHPTEGEGEQD